MDGRGMAVGVVKPLAGETSIDRRAGVGRGVEALGRRFAEELDVVKKAPRPCPPSLTSRLEAVRHGDIVEVEVPGASVETLTAMLTDDILLLTWEWRGERSTKEFRLEPDQDIERVLVYYGIACIELKNGNRARFLTVLDGTMLTGKLAALE